MPALAGRHEVSLAGHPGQSQRAAAHISRGRQRVLALDRAGYVYGDVTPCRGLN